MLDQLAVRPKETTFTRFDVSNYVGLFEKGRAQITCELVMEFVDTDGEIPSKFDMVCNLVATLRSVGEGDWQFSKMRLNAQEDNLIVHPVLTTDGIPLKRNSGGRGFVSNWILHDDRIGWFEGKRMLTVLPETDMPWYAIKHPEYLGSDEEQIIPHQFQDFAFDEDGMIIYDDGTPLDLRAEMEAMRTQIQGSLRVYHVAKVVDIQVDGDRAVAKTYNRTPFNPDYADPAKREQRCTWARYRFTLTRRKGVWKIDRLNYYPAFFVAE